MPEGNVKQQDFSIGMAKAYLNYAMSVIVDRALPDVRDGLKPVQRRILYAMSKLGFTPDKNFRKSATTVGQTLGWFHPHGDSSVYEAMVNLAQDFSCRYPLVHGHGNMGSIDGDPAAAMRYTEAKLSRISHQMLQDIDKNTVPFGPNFDNNEREPLVLPSLVPNLLANGSVGIAVGMATNIPPHNLGELYDAINYIIDCEMNSIEPNINDISKIVKGPDFPTGGIIVGTNGIKDAFSTGRGRIIVRAKYEVEENGNKTNIIVTEIPYRVNKSRLVERIDNLRKTEISSIKEVRDESDKEGLRIVIELKKDSNIQLTINKLLKHTDLQTSFNVNSIVLVDGQPKQLSLKEMLECFMSHAAQVILNRTQYDLDKSNARLNTVKGIIKAISNIDTIIDIIKNSDDPVQDLVSCDLGFNEEQAKTIADMRLRSLTNASRIKYDEEKNQLEGDIVKYTSIVEDQIVLLKTMKSEFTVLKEKFADKRRTEVINEEDSMEEEDLIKDEMLIVSYSSNGLIKSVEEKEYKTQNRGTKGSKVANIKDDEVIKFLVTVGSKEDILFFSNIGRCHVIKAYKIQKANRTGRGKSINNYLSLNEGEHIVSMLSTDLKNRDNHLLFVTHLGIIKRLSLEDLSTRMSTTKVINFKDNDSLVAALIVSPTDKVIITTTMGMSIKISMDAEGIAQIRPMGRAAAGVRGINLKNKKDSVVDVTLADEDATLFTITENGLGKRTKIKEYPVQNRGGKGVTTHKINSKTGGLIAATTVYDNDELFVATEQGLVIRINIDKISNQGRNTSGVKIMNLNEGDRIVSISKGNSEEEISSE